MLKKQLVDGRASEPDQAVHPTPSSDVVPPPSPAPDDSGFYRERSLSGRHTREETIGESGGEIHLRDEPPDAVAARDSGAFLAIRCSDEVSDPLDALSVFDEGAVRRHLVGA